MSCHCEGVCTSGTIRYALVCGSPRDIRWGEWIRKPLIFMCFHGWCSETSMKFGRDSTTEKSLLSLCVLTSTPGLDNNLSKTWVLINVIGIGSSLAMQLSWPNTYEDTLCQETDYP